MSQATLSYDSTAHAIQSHAFDHRASPDATRDAPAHHPVVVVGAGPVGLSLAIDLATRGQRVLLLDNDHRLSTGSRAICFAKRTLEVWDRLGVGDAMVAKGVGWSRGRVFFGDREIYDFNLALETGHERPAFINLQQYYAEAYLAVRAAHCPNLEIRWKSPVVDLKTLSDAATRLTIDAPEGRYTIDASWVVACDGSRSAVRGLLGQTSKGQTFRDRFLIADVRMAVDFPAERWFWFDPPFHRHQSVLLHRQPDGVWRIDFQLGWDADPEVEKQPERITPRVNAMMRQALGREVPFALEWASVYTFSCLRMEQFRHGRVLFAGDAAHGVSPFGARGANSGVQDADNLGWKLARVMAGTSPSKLLDSYAHERERAADENIMNSTRSTDFITPKSAVSKRFRDATLDLAREHAFARRLVNSGRLSTPTVLDPSTLNTADAADDGFSFTMRPGTVASDAPLMRVDGKPTWLLRQLGPDFTLLVFGPMEPWMPHLAGVSTVVIDRSSLHDTDGLACARYDARPGTVYLLRPDQHVVARWRRANAHTVRAAMARACGHEAEGARPA